MYINIDCSVQDLTQNFDNKWKSSCKKIRTVSQTSEVNMYTDCDFSIFVKFQYDSSKSE